MTRAVIVGFVSQKGGVGKSTLARALGAVVASGGFPPAAWIGCLSGVIAAVSMELLMIGYRSTARAVGAVGRS